MLLLGGLSACAGLGQPAPYDSPGINGLEIPTPSPAPGDFVDTVDNPWLALEPGAAWHYDVTEGGRTLGTIDAEVLDTTSDVAGLTATAVRTVTDLDGDDRDVEETRFYAQDDDGNVWLVGLDQLPGISWRAGEGNAQAGLAMPAEPRLGDGWLTYRLADLREASTTVEDQSREMVQTRDEADTSTRNVYESGVGLVSVEDLDAGWQAVLDD
ncbi:MAG: hypothetical protein JWN97_537 [Nocardioides sp.]|nr:hypothetical protein [Nocardioides sp.]